MATLVSCSKTVLAHSLSNSDPIVVMDHHMDCEYVNHCTWSHNGEVIATWGNDGKIILDHAKTGKKITELINDGLPILWVAFSSSSEYLAAGTQKGQVIVWSIKDRKYMFDIWEDPTEQITGVAWKSDDSIIVAITSNGLVYIINIESRVIANILQYDRASLRCLKFSYFKKNYVATSGDNGIVVVWDVKQSELYHAYEKSSHSDVWTGVIFSPTNELLLCSGGLDAKIQFFDIIEK